LSGQFCWADCAWLAVLPAVVLSTRPAKMSLPCEGSAAGFACRGGALWKDTFVAASDVTLCTDGLLR